jgi:hypothetical protein
MASKASSVTIPEGIAFPRAEGTISMPSFSSELINPPVSVFVPLRFESISSP